jgi:glycerol uptake facilitator-like aquaporin
MLGGIFGGVLVWLMYLPHWKATEDQGAKLGVFSTIKPPTISGFIPSAILFTPINKIPKHKIAVPIISST